jgi:hypothetical protein
MRTRRRRQSLGQELEERDAGYPNRRIARRGEPIVEKEVWPTNGFWPNDTPTTGNWS